jgi:hypothetical protein
MEADSLEEAKEQSEGIITALMEAAEASGVDVSGAEVVIEPARRRLLGLKFKVSIIFRGSAASVSTLTTFFASPANVAALLTALEAQGIAASDILVMTVADGAAADESWIGIPIGCSLARRAVAAAAAAHTALARSLARRPRERDDAPPPNTYPDASPLPLFNPTPPQGFAFLLGLYVAMRTYARKSQGVRARALGMPAPQAFARWPVRQPADAARPSHAQRHLTTTAAAIP